MAAVTANEAARDVLAVLVHLGEQLADRYGESDDSAVHTVVTWAAGARAMLAAEEYGKDEDSVTPVLVTVTGGRADQRTLVERAVAKALVMAGTTSPFRVSDDAALMLAIRREVAVVSGWEAAVDTAVAQAAIGKPAKMPGPGGPDGEWVETVDYSAHVPLGQEAWETLEPMGEVLATAGDAELSQYRVVLMRWKGAPLLVLVGPDGAVIFWHATEEEAFEVWVDCVRRGKFVNPTAGPAADEVTSRRLSVQEPRG
ncbi:MAG TPA: hypothetical protein VGB14_13350 [Acidimicrobiales bacterium]|jgi:hypothetical protein